MTISVTPNGNGTVTITCGTESVTIGSPGSSGLPEPKDAGTDIPILWPNGGATASIVAGGRARTRVVRVPDGGDLLGAIREQFDLHRSERETTIFQYHVEGSRSVQLEAVNKLLSDLGDPQWMGTQFKLLGPSNE